MEKNLKIVGESYTRGVVSIVDLIDAQNNALVSRVDASNAVYDFFLLLLLNSLLLNR